jgi:hypothetical protein
MLDLFDYIYAKTFLFSLRIFLTIKTCQKIYVYNFFLLKKEYLTREGGDAWVKYLVLIKDVQYPSRDYLIVFLYYKDYLINRGRIEGLSYN